MRRVLGLASLLLLVLAATARADGPDHTHQPVIDDPGLDGITVEVRAEPAPTLVLRNRTDAVVEVLDIVGDPFLRIGPVDVQGNVASPDFYRSESPSPAGPVPPSATGGTSFVHLVDGSDWAWFEHRITATPVDQEWWLSIRIGEREVKITGHWEAVAVPARVESTLDPVHIDGLSIQVLPGTEPGLYVGNDTGTALVVPGPRGEPFLRIGPDRTSRATPGGDSEVVAPTASYAWIDPRMGFQGDPPDGRTTRDWEIPARLGDRDLVLSGTTEWIPLDDGSSGGGGVPVLGVAAVVAVPVLLGLLFALRDRQGKRT